MIDRLLVAYFAYLLSYNSLHGMFTKNLTKKSRGGKISRNEWSIGHACGWEKLRRGLLHKKSRQVQICQIIQNISKMPCITKYDLFPVRAKNVAVL